MSLQLAGFEDNLSVAATVLRDLRLSRNSEARGGGQMGIYNLGCTCYIGSVLQQLQMIESFRRGIIASQPGEGTGFLGEFQRLFYELTFGQRAYLVPERFCLSYLDHNGKPVNTKEQHDADEFLSQLLDRLEAALGGEEQGALVSRHFRGEVLNVIGCEACFSQRQRVETFYILSLEIKHLRSLQECLHKHVETEIICDYYCDYCEQKVETTQKYLRFRALPPLLFIHLQRLVFDLESMFKVKLDHPVEFPLHLDLASYFASEGQPAQLYRLKGFVVHVGGSEGGHYYSIIRCQDDKWVKFDDTRVDDWQWPQGAYDKDHAYLLLYEKLELPLELREKPVKIGNKALMAEVRTDNFDLQRERVFLRPSFNRFLLQTLGKLHFPPEF
jgi:ubiquitin C-terminal hydrolase